MSVMVGEQADSNCAEVIIVGAGITGLGAAYHVGARGIPYLVLEAADDLGGIWRTHRWHGARCDSDIIHYSFRFKPLLSERRLLGAAQIQRYLRSVAGEFGILERVRFATRVQRAVFDPQASLWRVHTNRGAFQARFLINGNGYFEDLHRPAFRESDRFRGEIVHAFELDGGRTFAGKDVVLVGSGATAISCAPELARVSRSLVLLQRSPSYIYEMSDRSGPLARACQQLYRAGFEFPVYALRYALQLRDDLVFVGFRAFPGLARWLFRRHWVAVVGQQSFERDFRPRYDPWEQRVCVAVGLKEALRQRRIAIRTGQIDRFTESAIVLDSGEHIPCDVCVLATGFELNFLKFELYVGAEKISLAGRNFYKGVMMGGVPNYFQPVGVWHSAWTGRSEAATRFALKIIDYMKEKGLSTVRVDRRDVLSRPRITPNYVMRSVSRLPRLYGTYELPTLDNLCSYRFRPAEFRFA
jgi:monooxygenase